MKKMTIKNGSNDLKTNKQEVLKNDRSGFAVNLE